MTKRSPARAIPPVLAALAAAVLLPASGASAAAATVSTFAGGDAGGWAGSNGANGGVGTFVDVDDGTPAPSLRTQFTNFGITFRNDAPDWAGDYTAAPFTLSVDVNSRLINFGGRDVGRDLVLELRDYDGAPDGFPYVSVFYDLGDLGSGTVDGQAGWQTLSVTVDDPTQAALPAGWGGYGDEDPSTFEPILPPGRTFADVLSGVDQVALTTLKPGFSYGFADFDVAIDNPSLSFAAVPEPAGLATLGLAAAGLLTIRRRR